MEMNLATFPSKITSQLPTIDEYEIYCSANVEAHNDENVLLLDRARAERREQAAGLAEVDHAGAVLVDEGENMVRLKAGGVRASARRRDCECEQV